MQALKSNVNTRSDEFKANAAAMRGLVDDLRDKFASVAGGGGADACAKHVARGERIHIDTYDLLQPKTNIRLGSSYLRDLAQRFNGNRILATAAYNAGPNRISQILREQTHPLSADVWIEPGVVREHRELRQLHPVLKLSADGVPAELHLGRGADKRAKIEDLPL